MLIMYNVSELDEQVFELIYDAGIDFLKKHGTKESANEYEKCMKENPQIQNLMNTYQAYLKSPNKSNKSILTNLVTYIKNPTASNRAVYDLAVANAVNVRT